MVSLGCTPNPGHADQELPGTEESIGDPRFDPLDLPQDLKIVPVARPTGAGSSDKGATSANGEGRAEDEVSAKIDTSLIESVGGQVFRVQLFTSKLFGEAKQAKRVAEEIFDQAVIMDYEVPYFKVRVGAFKDRYEAEKYSQRVRAAGYIDAWVVATAAVLQRVAPQYNSDGSSQGSSTGSRPEERDASD